MSRRVEYIRNNQHKKDTQLAHELGIKPEFVEAIRDWHGLKSKKRRWQPEEVRILRENYGSVSAKRIASMLGRSKHAVQRKARLIGLSEKYGANHE